MDGDDDLVAALTELRDGVAATRFDLGSEGAASARAERDAVVAQIDDYLLPRLRQLDAPLLAVVGGSTGAGKSTLVNSLLGTVVSEAGVLRPTTRAPVLTCHPADRRWFEGDRVLPDLARTTGPVGSAAAGGPGTVHLVTTESLPAGLALLDAPDLDSVVSANRALAAQLLAAADLWVFVTTAARYADAVPWGALATASERDAAVAVVLDRVPPDAVDEVAADLRRMLDERGLGAVAVHPVREVALEDGLLPDAEVAPLRAWLHGLAGDAAARAEVIRTTLEGALSSVERRVAALAAERARQAATSDELREEVVAAYDEARDDVEAAMRDGALLRGEVLARWQEFVGTGELLRSVQARVGALRDRLVSTVTGRPTADAAVRGAVEHGVESVVRAAADDAAERSVARWRGSPAGRALLAGAERDLARASAVLVARLPEEVRAWQGDVLDLVRERGADKRTGARVASYTINGTGLAVMLGVFAQTGGLTGAELAVAGGTSAASQKVLEAVFGDQAVRTLAREARTQLLARVDRLLSAEAARFLARLDAAAPAAEPDLAELLGRWQRARRRLPRP